MMGHCGLINIPIGFRFDPTDEELISGFLFRKIVGLPLPWNGVLERDIYGENAAPWEVFSDIDDRSIYWHTRKEGDNFKGIKKTIYVFTKLMKACSNKNSKRVSRRAGCGTWSGQTGPKQIKNSKTGEIIGCTRMLSFQHSKSSSSDTAGLFGHWIMHEYCLDGVSLIGGATQDDLVLCKITKCLKENDQRHVEQPMPPRFCFSTSDNGGDLSIDDQSSTKTGNYEAAESSKKRSCAEEWNQEDEFDVKKQKSCYQSCYEDDIGGYEDDIGVLLEDFKTVENGNYITELLQGL